MLVAPNKKVERHFRSQSELRLPIKPTIEQKKELARRYKLTLACVGTLDSLRNHRANSDARLVHALHPQLQKKTLENVYRVNKSRSLKQILQQKLRTQQQRMNDLKVKEQARHQEIVRARKISTRQREKARLESRRETERSQQIERSWRQKTEEKQRSQSAFLLKTHRESIGMLKKSKKIQSSIQRSLSQDQLRETLRSSRYDQERKNLEKKRQKYQQQYRKAFLKNAPPPKQSLPDTTFYATLKSKAQKITQMYVLPQHLPSIVKQAASYSTAKKSIPGMQHELMICSMKPTQPRRRKQKIQPNPEVIIHLIQSQQSLSASNPDTTKPPSQDKNFKNIPNEPLNAILTGTIAPSDQ